MAVNVPRESEPRRRRRRTPEVAEQEIIAAAEALLRERPFRELTVDEVMRRTELSRPSFYVYFRDRHHLVLRVVEHIGAELFTMPTAGSRGEGRAGAGREATEGIVAVFASTGRCCARSPTRRPKTRTSTGVRAARQHFVDVTADHIEHEVAAAGSSRSTRARLQRRSCG